MVEKYKLYYRLFVAALWIPATWGFFSQEIVPFCEPLTRPVFLLCDAIFCVLAFATVRTKKDFGVVMSFLALGIISTLLVNKGSLLMLFNGTRDFLGLLLALPVLRYFFMHPRGGVEFKKNIDKQLRMWLWLQAFCVLWQFFKYGAGDYVGGSFGNYGSGMVSMMIYLVSFYLVSSNWDSDEYLQSLKRNKVYIFLLFPTFLNETKVSFILILIYLLFLFKVDRKILVRLAFVIPIMGCVMVGVGSLYFHVTNQNSEQVLSEEFFQEYLYGVDLDRIVDLAVMVQDKDIEPEPGDWWVVDLPRFAKIALLMPMMADDGKLFVGEGLGQFKGGAMVDETPFYQENEWLLRGTKPWLFFVLVQLGLTGVCWMYFPLAFLWSTGGKSVMSKRVKWFVYITMTIIMVYNDSLRWYFYCLMLFYLVMAGRDWGNIHEDKNLQPTLCEGYERD